MKVIVIDNYDSFTYNLVYILRQVAAEVDVYRNDKITPQSCLEYDAIILSPGPGLPKDAGNLISIIETCAGKVPILGVCLGHQAIAEYLGSKLRMLDKVYHGIQSTITLSIENNFLFDKVTPVFQAGRYHSWDVEPTHNDNFKVTALAEDDSIMALENSEQKLYGIQFHPESVLTPVGDVILKNFLSICIPKNQ